MNHVVKSVERSINSCDEENTFSYIFKSGNAVLEICQQHNKVINFNVYQRREDTCYASFEFIKGEINSEIIDLIEDLYQKIISSKILDKSKSIKIINKVNSVKLERVENGFRFIINNNTKGINVLNINYEEEKPNTEFLYFLKFIYTLEEIYQDYNKYPVYTDENNTYENKIK